MDNWPKEFWEMMESVSVSVESFVQDLEETIEAIAVDLQQDVAIDLERFWQQWIDPIWDGEDDSEPSFFRDFREEADQMLTPYVAPGPLVHKACIGCRNYHGHLYGGNLLVCGMHPFGWEDDHCPDWENG